MTHKLVLTILAVTALSTQAQAESTNQYDYVRFHQQQKQIDQNSMQNAQKGTAGRWLIRAIYNNVFDTKTPGQIREEANKAAIQKAFYSRAQNHAEAEIQSIIKNNGGI